MRKIIIPIVLIMCLIFAVAATAEVSVNNEANPEASQTMPQGERGNMGMPQMGDFQNRGTQPFMQNGGMPSENGNRFQRPSGNFTPPENFGGFPSPGNRGGSASSGGNESGNNMRAPQTNNESTTENSQTPVENNIPADQQFGGQMFGGQMPEGMNGFGANIKNPDLNASENNSTGFTGFIKTNSTPLISVILLALAFVFVIFYRRKNY